MLHPLLHLIATQPHLLADHAEAYAELVSDEVGKLSSGWKRQALYTTLGLVGLLVGAILAGVSILLWAVVPTADILAPWAMFVVPITPLVLALVCLLLARSPSQASAFENVRRQVRADLLMFREAGAS